MSVECNDAYGNRKLLITYINKNLSILEESKHSTDFILSPALDLFYKKLSICLATNTMTKIIHLERKYCKKWRNKINIDDNIRARLVVKYKPKNIPIDIIRSYDQYGVFYTPNQQYKDSMELLIKRRKIRQKYIRKW